MVPLESNVYKPNCIAQYNKTSTNSLSSNSIVIALKSRFKK